MHVAAQQRAARVVLADQVAAVIGKARGDAAADGLIEAADGIVAERRAAGRREAVVDVVAVSGRARVRQIAAAVIGEARAAALVY